MNKQQIIKKYSFDVRIGITNPDEPVTNIDKTIIAYNLDAVIEHLKLDYDLDSMQELTSDELSIFYEKSYLGQLSDHGNVHEITENTEQFLDENNEVKEEYESEYGYWRDVVDINGSEITEEDYKYMKSGYHNTVIDLTEDN